MTRVKPRELKVVYILPSRYDNEGYPLRYLRGVFPSNTLAALKGLTLALSQSNELGKDVQISVEIYDDGIQRVPMRRIVRESREPGVRVVVGLVGVQSNQFPRAADLALEFRKAGVPVMIGGFHVSGVLALFGKPDPSMQRLLDHGVTLVRGEVEGPGVLAGMLRDALEGRLQPIYNIVEAPDISTAAIPQPAYELQHRFFYKNAATIDTSRGCPFNCSFCTIINVQGRKMRHRSAECILKAIEENYAAGIDFYFFTDDNLARNPVWETLLDGLIALGKRGIKVAFMMQVDTAAWRIPHLIEKASQAGCQRVFIGMETINLKNVEATGKRQNKVGQFPEMVQAWRDAGILVQVGYIIGLPHDTRESVREEVATLRDHIKVDEVSFFMLTPLPGSRDHLNMVRAGTPLDADLNNYDSFHETFRHRQLKPGEWQAAYEEAWAAFYNKENIVNVLLRTPPSRYWPMLWFYVWQRYCTLEHIHPMVTGLIRLKDRKGRRPSFPLENVFRYAWRRTKDFAWMARTYLRIFLEFQEIWMLTRKLDDPRWATLADLRTKWADAQQRLRTSSLAGRSDLAAPDLRAMLKTASERLYELSTLSKTLSGNVRRKLNQKAREIEARLKSLDIEIPTWQDIVKGEKYISEGLFAGYENLAIRYVAKRRQINECHRELLKKLKKGRVLSLDVSAIPRALLFELFFGLRFGMSCFAQLR
jgi:radical SAM superfamily enzyme YgiQ (UPF0313 family)